MTPAGSPVLQAYFYALGASIVVVAAVLVGRAAGALGRSRTDAARLRRRFLIGAVLWIATVSTASLAGVFVPTARPPLPFLLLVAGVLSLGVRLARSSIGACLAGGLPLAWLVGFQAFRLPLELAMHRAYAEGVMPVQMSYSGRNFDIVTGTTALLLGIALAVWRIPVWVVRAWNWLGLLLLGNIVGVALLSTPVIAYFGPDRLNVFVAHMPYTWLPAVMVLAAWAGHLIVFRAIRLRAATNQIAV